MQVGGRGGEALVVVVQSQEVKGLPGAIKPATTTESGSCAAGASATEVQRTERAFRRLHQPPETVVEDALDVASIDVRARSVARGLRSRIATRGDGIACLLHGELPSARDDGGLEGRHDVASEQ